ncbi:MAG: S1C family serine protease [Lachnospiraceae bacterium]|jgi:serine protease Do
MRDSHKNRRQGRVFAAGALLAAALLAGSSLAGASDVYAFGAYAEETTETETAEPESVEAESAEDSGNGGEVTLGNLSTTEIEIDEEDVHVLPDVSEVAESCLASVVSITNTIEVTSTSGNSIENYFGFFGYGNNNDQNTETSESEAYGSGVIIGEDDTNLLIVTNNHVAVYDKSGNSTFYSYTASTKSLTVTFVDGTELEATLIGADAEADLAVIGVPLADLSDDTLSAVKAAAIGDSSSAKVGQGVIAIGNALGLGQTLTVGYISALDREVTAEDGVTRRLMQVDAAINGGNSGGGLFNDRGQLIGINSAKYEEVGVEGIGYAIPISEAIDTINELKNQTPRTVVSSDEKGYLGIIGQDVDSATVSYYGYPEGAQVMQIYSGSPAAEAGLQLGDIITAVNGTEITSYDELRTELSYYKAGETVTLTVSRISGSQFEEISIDVTLVSRDEIETN